MGVCVCVCVCTNRLEFICEYCDIILILIKLLFIPLFDLRHLARQQHQDTDIREYMSTTLRSRTLKATSTWDRDTVSETKTKIRRLKMNHGRVVSIRQAPPHLQG